jgi:hypothetical protein
MVLGEQQLDAPLSDRDCILRKLGGAQDLIFNNFDQAVLGRRQWEDGYRGQVRGLWERTVFYNYNVAHALPKGGAKLSDAADRRHRRLAKSEKGGRRSFGPGAWAFGGIASIGHSF